MEACRLPARRESNRPTTQSIHTTPTEGVHSQTPPRNPTRSPEARTTGKENCRHGRAYHTPTTSRRILRDHTRMDTRRTDQPHSRQNLRPTPTLRQQPKHLLAIPQHPRQKNELLHRHRRPRTQRTPQNQRHQHPTPHQHPRPTPNQPLHTPHGGSRTVAQG